MQIKNFKHVGLDGTDFIRGHISFQSACELTEKEKEFFELAFRLLTQYVENGHPLPFDGLRTNIVVIDSDEVTFVNTDEKSLGQHTSMVYYFIHKIRQKPKVHEAHYMATILEELCHALYLITDETEVKETVLEIVNQMDGVEISFDDWYQGENPPHLKPFLKRERLFCGDT